MTKNEVQEIGRLRWKHGKNHDSHSNGVGTWVWPTGMGKTYAACILINNVLNKTPEGDIIIFIPFVHLNESWQKHIDLLIAQKERVKIITIQYYILNRMYLNPLMAVFDELDEFYSDERIKVISKQICQYKYGLGLTATPEDKRKRHLKAFQYLPVVHIIPEEMALKNGWISSFNQFNLKVKLKDHEKQEYDRLTKIIGDCLGKFSGGYSHAMLVLVGDKKTNTAGYVFALRHATKMGWSRSLNLAIPEEREINDLWNPNKIIGYAKKLNECVRIRNNILNLCEAKYETVLELIKKFYKTKTIIFSLATPFADKINLLINERFSDKDTLFDSNYPYSVLYHSNMESEMVYIPEKNKKVKYGVKRLKEYYLDLVKKGFSWVISTAVALDKGLDIKDIRLAIITSGNSTTNRQKQREGRAKRIEDIPYEKPVVIINIYCDDTIDLRNLKDRQKNSLKEYIHWITDIDEIDLNIHNKKKLLKIE